MLEDDKLKNVIRSKIDSAQRRKVLAYEYTQLVYLSFNDGVFA